MLATVFLGSVYIITMISMTVGAERGFPWGYWYFFALGFDSLIFQPFIVFLQSFLLYGYIKNEVGETYKKWTRRLISTDVLSIVEKHFGKIPAKQKPLSLDYI